MDPISYLLNLIRNPGSSLPLYSGPATGPWGQLLTSLQAQRPTGGGATAAGGPPINLGTFNAGGGGQGFGNLVGQGNNAGGGLGAGGLSSLPGPAGSQAMTAAGGLPSGVRRG